MGAPVDKSWLLREFRETLRILSAPPEEQLAYLTRSGPVSVDELGLDFSITGPAVLQQFPNLTEEQRSAILSLDRYLDQMSGSAQSELWTEEALFGAREWQDIRRLAADAERKLTDMASDS